MKRWQVVALLVAIAAASVVGARLLGRPGSAQPGPTATTTRTATATRTPTPTPSSSVTGKRTRPRVLGPPKPSQRLSGPRVILVPTTVTRTRTTVRPGPTVTKRPRRPRPSPSPTGLCALVPTLCQLMP